MEVEQKLQIVVDVRINNVHTTEIMTLKSVVGSLARVGNYDRCLVNTDEGVKDFVITINSGELEGLKSALRLVLRIVAADRIEIDV